MNTFIDLIEPYFRFWPYAAAGGIGMVLAVVDRKAFGRYVFAALLVLIAIGGQLTTVFSPFTFSGNDYYMQGLIASLFALAGLAGYAIAALAMKAFGSASA